MSKKPKSEPIPDQVSGPGWAVIEHQDDGAKKVEVDEIIVPISQEIVAMDTHLVKPYWRNPRFNDDAVDAVAQSIREFGFRNPIQLDRDLVVITGHTRLKAAIRIGMKKVPCIIAKDLSPDQARDLRIIDNKTSEKAKWNKDDLDAELRASTSIAKFHHHFADLQIHSPNVDGVSQADIDAKSNQVNDHFRDIAGKRGTEIKKFVCPHCGGDFEVL